MENSIAAFRKWVNNVLKQYNMKGYAINEKCLQALEKTVDIQSGMFADALDIEESNVLRAVNEDGISVNSWRKVSVIRIFRV